MADVTPILKSVKRTIRSLRSRVDALRPVDASGVVDAYRLVLGRDPENAAVVSEYVRSDVSVVELFYALLKSDEFASRSNPAVREVIRETVRVEIRELPPPEPKGPFVIASAVMGEMIVRVDDEVIGATLRTRGDFETGELARATRFLIDSGFLALGESSRFIDVGANLGTHTHAALRNLGFARGTAIEPSADNHRLLRANLILNELETRVDVHHAAASEFPGVAKLRKSPRNRGDFRIASASCGGIHGEHDWPVEDVPLVRIDDVVGDVDPASTFVWIDTQGHERAVLRGMRRLLGLHVPVAFEFWPYGLSENATSCTDLLDALDDYALHDLHSPDFSVVDPSTLEAMYADFLSREADFSSPHTMLLATPKR